MKRREKVIYRKVEKMEYKKQNPNAVIIYADDLGYGDLSCYGAEEIHTPNIDRLAEEGILFQNAYSASAVCTPARYCMITGRYPFRNPNTFILPGNAKCIIEKDTMTLPKIFQQAGYKTGVVGKWHLGLGDGNIDWNREIPHTPNDVGFDYSFIFPGTNDRVPCVYVRNHKVVGLEESDLIEVSYETECPYEDIDTYQKNPEKLRMQSSHGHNMSIVNGIGRIGYMRGGKKAVWKDENLAEDFLNESKSFIDECGQQPFFLLYTVHQPHVPRVPKERFRGATGLGPRGDVIAELDWCVGELISHLEKKGILENTLILFSSDNGPVLNDGYQDRAVELNGAHHPTGPLRGGKYSKYDGGARIPFLAFWKGTIQPQVSDALLFQGDLAASFAAMLNVKVMDGELPDSENHLAALLGDTTDGRKEVLYESVSKARVLRQGKWEYLEPSKGGLREVNTGIELGNSKRGQLYNMQYDPGQREDVIDQYPNVAKAMDQRIREILDSSRTR